MTEIKVGTIVNIMRVNYDYVHRIAKQEQLCNYYEAKGDKTNLFLAKIQLKKDRAEYGQFLDFYI